MELNYKTFGQGDPLIILHGLFGSLDNWQTLGKQFAEHYTVFLLDQRNHGRSPHDPEFDYAALAADLKHFLESHWVYKTHLLGHSMGGKTAMEFALHYPDMVDKLVVVDIGPKAYSGGHELIMDALLSVDLDAIDSRQAADEALQARISEYGIRQFLLKNLHRNKDGTFSWKMNLPILHQHYDQILSAIEGDDPFEGPALFIRGSRSNYIEDGDWPAILELFPRAELATVPQAGHWVHADAPELLLERVHRFLETA
ncbi:MAG: alpha/beta fold hydrolase [Saprospiraceae bacterium]|nr:alpha/beta fold hydrolase [Saprospiraceae bacterium]MCB0623195.1 alpha/beta fold hydrolase [Saprospiraceae bacterium]